MTLISVLLALGLDRMLFLHRESAVQGWFGTVLDTVAARLPSDWEGLASALLVIAPPVIGIALLQWLLWGWLFGLPLLALGVLVLLFTLGPLDIVGTVDDYLDACANHDRERAVWYYERITGELPPDDPRDEGRRMVESILYQGHDNLFANVFWFCLLGPFGAILYRMIAEGALRPAPAIVARPVLQRSFRHLLGLLGWIPARLVAFGYAMTGSFEEAVHRLREGARPAEDLLAANRALLLQTGSASLRRDDRDNEPVEHAAQAERRSGDPGPAAREARALALRAAVFWLAVLALLTLAGWFA